MDEIAEQRGRIDRIDRKIVDLIAERMEAAKAIGSKKRAKGLNIVDSEREKRIINQAKLLAEKKKLSPSVVSSIFGNLLKESRRTQSLEGTVVAFQGERGAYSELVLKKFFPSGKFIPLSKMDFRDVFESLKNKEADFAAVPIENSTEGSVAQTCDLLIDYDLHIVGEKSIRINHCLMSLPSSTLQNISEVYSHPQAIGQCRNFLNRKLKNSKIIPFYDTAGAAKMISSSGNPNIAAIASEYAADYYGLNILSRDIEDNKNNRTRFLLLSRHQLKNAKAGKTKTSIVFSLKHVPGALFSSLKIFASSKINMTKIESRPTKDKPWEYLFFIDFEGSANERKCASVISNLKKHARFLKILGSYPAE